MCVMETAALLTPLGVLPPRACSSSRSPSSWASAGIVAASCSASFSFLPLDRHLRRGVRFMLTEQGAS